MSALPAPIVPSSLVADDAAERASDDGVLVTVGDLDPNLEMPLTTANTTTDPSASGEGGEGMTLAKVTAALSAMGFTDSSMVEVVLDKHGADIHACARDLAAATEWDPMLDDLEEMGFEDRGLNKRLMVKHDGSVKRTVKELVAEADMM